MPLVTKENGRSTMRMIFKKWMLSWYEPFKKLMCRATLIRNYNGILEADNTMQHDATWIFQSKSTNHFIIYSHTWYYMLQNRRRIRSWTENRWGRAGKFGTTSKQRRGSLHQRPLNSLVAQKAVRAAISAKFSVHRGANDQKKTSSSLQSCGLYLVSRAW
jgi:hypothetical protein